MVYYFDSSSAVKRYAPEKGSEWVKDLVNPAEGNVIYLGQIGVVEIAAALSKKVRTKELAQENYEAALQLFLTDVHNEEYITAPLSDSIIQQAVALTKRPPLRGYDAVHLATAISLNTALFNEEFPPLVFVSGDHILCEATRGEGLIVENPDDH